MNYEDVVDDFICTPENLDLAFQINERLPIVRQKLHQRFWDEFKLEINSKPLPESWCRWSGSGATGRTCSHEWMLEDATKNKFWLAFRHTFAEDFDLFYFCIEQLSSANGCYDVSFGIAIDDEKKQRPWEDYLEKHVERLRGQGFVRDNWWLGRKQFESSETNGAVRPQSKEFSISMANHGGQTLIRQLADEFWTFFEENYREVEKINQAIVSKR
jgi:hypothetical protein